MISTDRFVTSDNSTENYPNPTLKPCRKLRFLLIAAVLIALVTIPLTIILAQLSGRTPPPPIPTTTLNTVSLTPTTTTQIPVTSAPITTKAYQSLYDMPEAIIADEESLSEINNRNFSNDLLRVDFNPMYPTQLLSKIESNQYPVVLGSVEKIDAQIFMINGNYIEHYSVVTVNVTDRLYNASDIPDTIKISSISRYTWSLNTAIDGEIPDGFFKSYYFCSAPNIVTGMFAAEKFDLADVKDSFLFILSEADSDTASLGYPYKEYSDYLLVEHGYPIYDSDILSAYNMMYGRFKPIPLDDIRALAKELEKEEEEAS